MKIRLYSIYILSIYVLSQIFANTSVVYAAAGAADRFVVQVGTNPIQINEPVDLSIKAVDTNSDIVKDYQGDIYMEIIGLKDNDYIMPADGIYTFAKNDQGAKVFSKGLIVKKEGEYKLKISEVLDDKIVGQTSINIVSKGGQATTSKINISSPVSGSIETNSSVSVVGSSSIPNSPLDVYIDGNKVKSTITSPEGSFNVIVDGISEGIHSLQTKISSTDGILLGESDILAFSHKSANIGGYKSINITPASIAQGDKVKIQVLTDDSVQNVVLAVQGIDNYVMDKLKNGEFTKEIKIGTIGKYNINLKTSSSQGDREYPAVGSISVTAPQGIQNIKILRDGDPKVAKLSWQTNCSNAKSFQIRYGFAANKLSYEKTSDSTSSDLTVDPNRSTYIQVQAIDAQNQKICMPSAIVRIEPIKGSAIPSQCVVDGIYLSSQLSNGKNFLTWQKVSNVDRYIVYKKNNNSTSDGGFADMEMIGETSQNYFEIPWDNKSSKPVYYQYAVQAICSDGSSSATALVKQIQVGPEDAVFYGVLIFIFIVLSYKLMSNRSDV